MSIYYNPYTYKYKYMEQYQVQLVFSVSFFLFYFYFNSEAVNFVWLFACPTKYICENDNDALTWLDFILNDAYKEKAIN